MSLIVNITCPDQKGIVMAVSSTLAGHDCNILESSQFFQPDPGTHRDDGVGKFFLRVECAVPDGMTPDQMKALFDGFGQQFKADIWVYERRVPLKTIIMVSKFDHCLQDILYRVRTGVLPLDIQAVVSNHPDTRGDVERLGIPFHLAPVSKDNKAEQEARLTELMARTGTELLVLARYMQILSDDFASKYAGQIINIHHSFLPAFKGAKPYHRAHERGVKMIGATAHYVTADLDEGPIIEQDAERITHAMSPEDLVQRGQEVEARVLARAVSLHAHRRVFIADQRTIVFSP
ncbi:MAG: formyltetrahydrofolate deformylase [Pseudomonadota bacterium]